MTGTEASILQEHSWLATAAVAGDAFVGGNLTDRITAAWAGFASLVVDLQEVARLQVDVIADAFAEQWDRVGYDLPRLVVEAAKFVFG